MTETAKKKSFPLIRNLALPIICLAALSLMATRFRDTLRANMDPSQVADILWYDKLLIVAFTLVGFFLIFRLTAVFILDGLLAMSMKRKIPKILKDVIGICFGFVAILISVHILFSEAFSGFLAVSGILGVVIGLALRPIILDIFSGVSTNMEAAFQIGDWITVEDGAVSYTGWVDQINWRTTHIRTRAGNLIVCPNSFLSTSIVSNHSRPYPYSRYEIKVKLPPELPTDRALRVLRNAVRATVDTPGGPSSYKSPDILLTELTDSGVEYWIRFWVDPANESYDTAIHKVSESVMRHLRTAGMRLAASREHLMIERAPRFSRDYHKIEDRLDLLESLELFAGVQRASLQAFAGAMELKRFRAGEDYFKEGDSSTEMYILLEGSLMVTKEQGDVHVELTTLQPGDYFGEMALLTDELRSATVRSFTDSLSFSVERSMLKQFLQKEPAILKLLSRNLAARKLENDAALRANLSNEVNVNESLSQLLLSKMKALFRLTRRPFVTEETVEEPSPAQPKETEVKVSKNGDS